jgi:hypothetical protein
MSTTYSEGLDEKWDRGTFVWVESSGTATGYCQFQETQIDDLEGDEDDDEEVEEDDDADDDDADDTEVVTDYLTLWVTTNTWADMMDTGALASTYTRGTDDTECESCMSLGNAGMGQCVFLNANSEATTVIFGYASGEMIKAAAASIVGLFAIFNL